MHRPGVEVTPNRQLVEPPILGAEGAARWLREHGHPRITGDAVRQALRRARVARAKGDDAPRWFPEPDASVDVRTPGWHVGTPAAWQAVGRGAGGGRPKSRER